MTFRLVIFCLCMSCTVSKSITSKTKLEDFEIKRPHGVELGELSVDIKAPLFKYDKKNDLLSINFQAFTKVSGEKLDNVFVIKENGLQKDTIVFGKDNTFEIQFIAHWHNGDTLVIHPLTCMPSYYYFH